jgi:hypothetical protein
MSEAGQAGEPLYDECRNCEGGGTEPFRTERNGNSSRMCGGGTCTQCDGLGIIPTAEGLNPSLLKRMLPILAMLVAGHLAGRSGGQQGGLGGVLGSVLVGLGGGGAGGALGGSAGGGLGGVLGSILGGRV